MSIHRISSTIRTTDAAAAPGAAAELSGDDLDRLAAVLLERQRRLLENAAALSLEPDDPAGELGGRR